MISKETKQMIAEKHYEDFKEEVMDLISIPELEISNRLISMCNDLYNEEHCDDAFDDAREIIEMIEEKWVHEQFKNISGFNTPEFLSKYETKVQCDLRVKMHGQNEFTRGFEDAVQIWERNFATMSAYQFAEWKLQHQPKCPPDSVTEEYTDEPTPEEEQAWMELAKRIERGDK